MSWKPMKDMTREEAENLLVRIFGIKRVEKVISNDDENTLSATIVTEEKDDNGNLLEVESVIKLTPETIIDFHYSKNAPDYHDYKQYMLSNRYNEYWRNNPFI